MVAITFNKATESMLVGSYNRQHSHEYRIPHGRGLLCEKDVYSLCFFVVGSIFFPTQVQYAAGLWDTIADSILLGS